MISIVSFLDKMGSYSNVWDVLKFVITSLVLVRFEKFKICLKFNFFFAIYLKKIDPSPLKRHAHVTGNKQLFYLGLRRNVLKNDQKGQFIKINLKTIPYPPPPFPRFVILAPHD